MTDGWRAPIATEKTSNCYVETGDGFGNRVVEIYPGCMGVPGNSEDQMRLDALAVWQQSCSLWIGWHLVSPKEVSKTNPCRISLGNPVESERDSGLRPNIPL